MPPESARRPRPFGFFALALGGLGLGFVCVPWVGIVLSCAGTLLGLLALLLGQRGGFTVPGTVVAVGALALNLSLPLVWPEKFPGFSTSTSPQKAE